MSIEAMKLAAEFNRYFTSANGVDVPARVSVSRDEWRQLFAALSQQPDNTSCKSVQKRLEAQQPATGEPVKGLLRDMQAIADGAIKIPAREFAMHALAEFGTHPAPSVPTDVVRDAERYRFIRDADVSDDLIPDIALYAMESLDEYIDAAMLAAKDASA